MKTVAFCLISDFNNLTLYIFVLGWTLLLPTLEMVEKHKHNIITVWFLH